MAETQAPTRAQKIGSLHAKICRMAAQFDGPLQAMFDEIGCDGVSDELALVGRDGEVIRLRVVADRLTGAEREEALARVGRSAR